MKRLHTFEEFVNESANLITEGSMAKAGVKLQNGYSLEDESHDKWRYEISNALGVKKDLSKVVQIDSEWEDNELPKSAGKIFNYLEKTFRMTKQLNDHNEIQNLEYDEKLNVVKFDDYGMTGYCFTADSNF